MDCEIEKNKISKKSSYGKAFKAAFPYTIPVMTGYLFIGMAFGVMIQEKGYNFLWAILMSVLCYAGSGQYLAVNFFAPGVSLLQVIFMEFMLNIRHIFYGLSLLERFAKMGKKRLYMIFSLTDETYSLFFVTKVPKDVEEGQFLFAIALLDQLYWIIGSAIGALLGSVLPIDTTGIDFADDGVVRRDHGGAVDGVKKPSERTDRTWMRTGLSSDLWRRQFYSADHDLYYADPASVQKVFG